MARKRKTKKRRPAKRTRPAVLASRVANRSICRALAEAVEEKEAEQKSSPSVDQPQFEAPEPKRAEQNSDPSMNQPQFETLESKEVEQKDGPPEKLTVDSDQLSVTRCREGDGAVGRPTWAPEDVDLKKVPAPVRQAVVEVVEPAYQKMVVETEDPMERSIGLTMVHLMWLEVLDQHEAKYEYLQTSVLNVPEDRSDMIDRHLRVLNTKVKVASCLTRLRETRRRVEAAAAQAQPALDAWGDVPVIPDTRPYAERGRLHPKRKLGAGS